MKVKQIFERYMVALVLMGGLFVLAGCNTVMGAGEDATDAAGAVLHAL